MIELTYEDRADEQAAWSSLYNEWFGTDSAKRMTAQMNSNIWQPLLEDQEGVQTRLNEMPTVSMLLCRSLSKKDAFFIDDTSAKLGGEEFLLATAKAIHRNMVKVPLHHFDSVEACPEFAEYIYESQCAGIVKGDGFISAKGLKEGVRLFYSDEMGLLIEKTSGKEGV